MKHINFLPGAKSKNSFLDVNLMQVGLVILLLAIISLLYLWWFKGELNQLLAERDQLATELANLRNLKSNQDIKNLSASQEKNIEQGSNYSLANLMQDLQQRTPANVKINKLTNNNDSKIIMIEASIHEQGAIAQLGDSFREASWCEKFRLDNLSKTESEQGELDNQIKFSCPQE